jgi:hypothetical protein
MGKSHPFYVLRYVQGETIVKTLHSLSAYVLVALGTGHTLLTPIFYPGFSADALWFAGTGLALLFLGLLNIAAQQNPIPILLNLCVIANLMGAFFLGLVTCAVPEFQAFVALLAASGLVVSTLAFRKDTPVAIS